MSNEIIRILLVDDHKMVRDAWKMILEHNPRFVVIADCDNGHTAIAQAQQLVPDIMLVDINMSPLNGFAVTEQILQKMPAMKIIGLSANNQPQYATRMLALGAWGYLTKTTSIEEITHGIIEVHTGKFYICEEIKRNIPPAE